MPSLELSCGVSIPSSNPTTKPQREVRTYDRFIRNRDEIQRRFVGCFIDNEKSSADPIIDQKMFSKSEETYKHLVASTLSLDHKLKPWVPQWPVKPRVNPILTSPRVVLDLPNINRNYGHNIMDWSSSSYLTVGFPRSVYMWHSSTNRTLRIDYKNVSCIKWNNEGTALFLASSIGTYSYRDIHVELEFQHSGRNSCHHSKCFVTCCVFHPKSPLVYIGCCKGSVCVYHINKGLHIITVMHEDLNQVNTISMMGVSCDGRHLAVASMADYVVVYDTINYSIVCSILMTGPSKALAWHPWKRNLLMLSDCNGCMALYDTLDPWYQKSAYFPNLQSSILNLAFNPISAELVVSQRIFLQAEDSNNQNQSRGRYVAQLNVISSFDRVVDRMEGHLGAVHYLCWNPDGTQLVTAGDDETAHIWDFLPNTGKHTKKPSIKLNYVSASLEMGNRMGLALR